jgi:hypothetical protein
MTTTEQLNLGALSVDRLRSMYAMALTVGDHDATQAIAREVKARICRGGRAR